MGPSLEYGGPGGGFLLFVILPSALIVLLLAAGYEVVKACTHRVSRNEAVVVENKFSGRFAGSIQGPCCFVLWPWQRLVACDWRLPRRQPTPHPTTHFSLAPVRLDIDPGVANDIHNVEVVIDAILTRTITNIERAVHDSATNNLDVELEQFVYRMYRKAAAQMTYDELCGADSNERVNALVAEDIKTFRAERGVSVTMVIQSVKPASTRSQQTMDQAALTNVSLARSRQDIQAAKANGEAAAAHYKAMRDAGMNTRDIQAYTLLRAVEKNATFIPWTLAPPSPPRGSTNTSPPSSPSSLIRRGDVPTAMAATAAAVAAEAAEAAEAAAAAESKESKHGSTTRGSIRRGRSMDG